MRPSTLRRLGATLLFALYLPSCVDAPLTAPDAARPASRAAEPATRRVKETTLAQGEYSLVVRHQGRKLHAVTATRGGKPLTQLQWQHPTDGQASRLSARVWAKDGSVRELPDVRGVGRSEDARLSVAPAVSLPQRSVGAYGCWYELSMVFVAITAIWSAVYAEDWSSLAGLFLALEEALQRYFDCLDQTQSPSM